MESDPVTPKDLAIELGVSPKSIRDFLRALYGTLGDGATRWNLTPEQVELVRTHFDRGRSD
ncbi:hypothetical protein ASF06_08865 [Agreia sp. Leaf244]|uniref:hypothetical protein n=1 Tax=Agreia sp. Leaf244 TaxID=1736305 RepID=UPI0006FFAB2D|nr:hypothetical protein [Agreia sp. Leaf244]KQO10278.1 hypothetical protein ASF06_08865 [Agreia sp. Leaf244]